jgi:nitrogen fixation protein FixH
VSEYGDIFNTLALTSWIGVVVAFVYHASIHITPFNSWWEKFSKRIAIRKRY